MIDHDAQMRQEYEWQEFVRDVVNDIDRKIFDKSDGTEACTDDLTRKVAQALFTIAHERKSAIGMICGSFALQIALNTDDLIAHKYDEPVIRGYLKMQIAQEFVRKAAIPISFAVQKWLHEQPVEKIE